MKAPAVVHLRAGAAGYVGLLSQTECGRRVWKRNGAGALPTVRTPAEADALPARLCQQCSDTREHHERVAAQAAR